MFKRQLYLISVGKDILLLFSVWHRSVYRVSGAREKQPLLVV